MTSQHVTRKPRLLHVTTVPQTLAFLDHQVNYVQSQGVEVHAAASPGPELGEFGARTQSEVHPVEMRRQITPLRDLRSLWNLGRLLSRIRPDIVHGHTPKGGLLAMIAAWIWRVPVRVYHIHGLPLVTATGLKRLLLRWSEKASCRLASQVLCVSDSVRQVAVTEKLCAASRIKVLLQGSINGVDAELTYAPAKVGTTARAASRNQYGIPHDALVLGFIGRIVRDKGMIELAEAWKVLREQFPNLHLLVVGPWEPYDAVPDWVTELLRGDPRIHCTGWLPADRIPPIYPALDLLVLPTYREGLPTVLLEAAAMEIPVVATRATGCVDAVQDGRTGTLVPVGDAAALAAAIRRYLEDPELRRAHGQAGRERVLRDFRPQALSEAIHQEYLRLLRERNLSDHAGLCSSEPVGWAAMSRDCQGAGALSPLPDGRGSCENVARPLGNGCAAPLPDGRGSCGASNFYRRLGKRLGDIVIAVAALIALAPLLAVVAVVVRCFLGSPVIFRQQRQGLHRKPFTMFKFRTMTSECDAAGKLLPDTQRLTRLGRLLRSTSLDELPELFNVLRGDMSTVGPRPLLMNYEPFYRGSELRRFDVRPGITGWAQISGRNNLSWDDRFLLDVRYTEACSLSLDVKILLWTVIKVLRREGVQVDPGRTLRRLDEERQPRGLQVSDMGAKRVIAMNSEVLTTRDQGAWMQLLEQCTGYDFYHLPQYHLVAEEEGEGLARLFVHREGACTIALPLLFRPLPPELDSTLDLPAWQDATSVYGYAGPVCTQHDVPNSIVRNFQAALQAWLREQNIVTLFSRLHPLMSQRNLLAGLGSFRLSATVAIDLTLPDQVQRNRYRRNHWEGINRLLRRGVSVVHDCDWAHFEDFLRIYEETMHRVGAASKYFFSRRYFERLRAALGSSLHLFVCRQEAKVVCGGLFVECGKIVQHHLSGTGNDALKLAPAKLLVDGVREWASARRLHSLHLGGGSSADPNDSLLHFKMGFSDHTEEFAVWRWVVLPEVHRQLCEASARWNAEHQGHPTSHDFFPEYRTPTAPQETEPCLQPCATVIETAQQMTTGAV